MREPVLLVENDASDRENIGIALTQAGLDVTQARDADEAVRYLADRCFDLLVVDIPIGQAEGVQLCTRVRGVTDIPILMLGKRSNFRDVVEALESGADDYLAKPFAMPELRARARALLRRHDEHCGQEEGASTPPPVNVGRLEVDPASYNVRKDGKQISLSATEFKLLYELARHKGQVLTRDTLLRRVWNEDFLGESKMIEMAVSRLRGKIDDVRGEQLIVTVRGVGYRLETDG